VAEENEMTAEENEMTEVIRVRVRAGFSERIKGQAQRETKDSAAKVTVSDVIRKAVEAYLKRHGG
jgi:phage-related protein